MDVVPASHLRLACEIFLRSAYPQGADAIPPAKRKFLDLDANRPIADLLPPSPFSEGIGQILHGPDGDITAYTFRLGCSHFPHLKLKVQIVNSQHGPSWLYAVDTHDAFSKDHIVPPPDHPEAAAWTKLQADNRNLKEQIESAWEAAGVLTFKHFLRLELQDADASR